jgi:NADH-quinone oxidoreductase subunit K
MVPFSHALLVSALLFAMGMFCLLVRRNLIMMLLGIEVMLNASALAFVAAALNWQHLDGQSMVIFILTVAATEVSVGLALMVTLYRRTGSVDPDPPSDPRLESAAGEGAS